MSKVLARKQLELFNPDRLSVFAPDRCRPATVQTTPVIDKNATEPTPRSFSSGVPRKPKAAERSVSGRAAYLQDIEVAAHFGVARSTIWRWCKTNPHFPKPVKLSSGTTSWRVIDLEAFETRISAAVDDDQVAVGRPTGKGQSVRVKRRGQL